MTLFISVSNSSEFIKALAFYSFQLLLDEEVTVRQIAQEVALHLPKIFKDLILKKPGQIYALFKSPKNPEQSDVIQGFSKLMDEVNDCLN
jgi:hypothetical protein